MNIIDSQYKELLNNILKNGEERSERTGTGMLTLFNPPPLVIDVSDNKFPLLTLRKIPYQSIIHECIWMFVQGSTNIDYLKKNNVNIWNSWSNTDNELGPIYGANFRSFQSFREIKHPNTAEVITTLDKVDQMEDLIEGLKLLPFSRRHVLTGWNPGTVPAESKSFETNILFGRSSLPQCHSVFIQFDVNRNNEISMYTYTRSNDLGLGFCFNVCMSTILLRMIAQVTGYKAKNITYTIGNAHIYLNHLDGVKELLSREVKHKSPELILNTSVTNFNDFKFEDFIVQNYEHQDPIKFSISV